MDMISGQPELGQQGPHLTGGHLRHGGLEGVHEWLLTGEDGAGLVDLTDVHPGAQTGSALIGGLPPEQQPQQGGFPGPVGPGDDDAFPGVDLE